MNQKIVAPDIYGNGTPLVLVNGLYNDKVAWCRLAAELGPQWSVYIFNFPGQGMDRREPLATMAEHALYLKAALESWGLSNGRAIVAGLSSGADIVRLAHCVLGVKTRGVALLGANPGGLKIFWEQVTESLVRSLAMGVEGFARQSMHLFFSPTHFARNRAVAKSIEDAFAYCYTGREKQLTTLINVLLQDDYIDCPPSNFTDDAFLIWGNSDAIVPVDASNAYIARCDSSKVTSRYVSGGHSFAFESPKETAELLNSLLSRFVD